ncbi:hypothetical protein DPEC_G00096860 [Dallia pectoralis]|uniref:Uncharacterized protein n=1 Tax=Dallia pectoralis TaxID=75939 RepID=A0ACC2GVP2_DALPE|nr:hypothetical protein DPEC_G00096860 [Dallia pectoralis]
MQLSAVILSCQQDVSLEPVSSTKLLYGYRRPIETTGEDGKRQMSILSCFAMKDQLPKKVAMSEKETVDEAVEETARVSVEDESMEETVEETIEETVEN